MKYAFPTQGYVAWMDNVVPMKVAPDRDSAITFMKFLLMPANIATGLNSACHGSGPSGGQMSRPGTREPAGVQPAGPCRACRIC